MKPPGEKRFQFWPRALSLQSMRGRMAVLLGLAMLPAGAIAMQVGLNAVKTEQTAVEQNLSRRALQSIESERGTIDELREMLRVLATSPPLQQIERGDCQAWLGEVRAEYDFVAAIAVIGENNVIRCSIPAAPAGAQTPANPLRRRAMVRDDFTAGYVERGPLAGEPVLAALQPIHDGRQRRIGFVGASISVDHLKRMLERDSAIGGAHTAIVDFSGRVIAESAPAGSQVLPLPPAARVLDHFGNDPSFVAVPGGEAVIVPLAAPDIYAVMSWTPDQSPWRRSIGIATSVAAPLLIWLVAVAAGWWAIEIFVARPLSTLEAAARSMARGEEVLDTPALASAPTEIRSLRRTLAAMAKTLRGREARLVEALGEERALLREVHHRVKNNLQMVASLLNIQARGARDESEAWGLARAHDRVQLLALVHQRVYASGAVRELRLDDLAAEIARQLLQARGAATKDLHLQLQLSEARCDADRAVPLAFLIGEGLSMTLDTLTENAQGELRLFLQQDADGTRFAICADIEGVAPGVPAASSRLIDAFARQLGASVGRNAEKPFMLWVSVPPGAESHAQ